MSWQHLYISTTFNFYSTTNLVLLKFDTEDPSLVFLKFKLGLHKTIMKAAD